MAVTIKDVAKLANVSTSTVSRVIADSPKISDETKKRVFEAIEELKYYPNAAARNLANNTTKTLGLILPNQAEDLFKNPFFIQIMTGISVYAQSKGYYIMYSFGNNEQEELQFINNYIQSKLVDGIILLTSRTNDKCIKVLKERKYPFVVVGRPEETSGVMWVDNDNFQAMYSVVDRLINKGASTVAFIGGPSELNVSKDRYDGYIRALIAHNKKLDSNLIVHKNGFTENLGYEAMNEILKYKIPTAVVTTDDLLAFGALKALKDSNNSEVCIIGFNDTPLAAYQTPAMSSVNINPEKLGYQAAKLLIRYLEKKLKGNTHYIIDTNLVERESFRL